MASIFRRGKYLYIQFSVDGKIYHRSTKLEDTKENIKYIKTKIIPALNLKIVSGEFKKVKIKDFEHFANIYLRSKENLKSYHDYENVITNQLFPHFRKTLISEVKRYDIKTFVDLMLQSKSPNRVRTILNMVKAIIDIAIDYEIIKDNPANDIKLPKHIKQERKPFTKEEVKLLIDTATGWFKNYLAFAFFTGARIGEILALNWSDINLSQKYITINKRIKKGKIGTTKTQSSNRDVPIFDSLMPYIIEQKKYSNDENVFINPRNKKPFYDAKRLTPHWKRLLNKANLEYEILYTTRHTFITNMLKSGKLSILDIAQIVGHTNTEMIIKNYAKYIKGEQLKISRAINPFD
jgi:integrase